MNEKARSISEQANSFYKNAEYKKALEKFSELLEPELKLSERELAQIKSSIGDCLFFSEDYSDAVKNYLQYYEKLSRFTEVEQEVITLALLDIAHTFYRLSNYTEAIKYYSEALIICINTAGENSEDASDINRYLGICYDDQKLYSEAVPYFQNALKTSDDIFEENDIRIMVNRYGLANCYFNNNYDLKALDLFIQLYNYKTANPDDETLLSMEALLGKITTLQLKYNEVENSESYFVELYNITKSKYGEENFDTTTGASKLGQYYYKTENYKKAKEYFALSFKIRNKILGKEDNYTLSSAEWLYATLTYLDEWREAEKIYKEIPEIRRKLLKEDNPKLLSSIKKLARIYYELEEYSKSEELYIEAITKCDKIYNYNSTETLDIKFDLSDVYYYDEEYQKAVNLLKEMLDGYITEHEGDETTVKIMKKLTDNLYYIQSKSREAEYYYIEAINIYKNKIELKDFRYFKLNYDLGLSYAYNSNDYSEAEKAFQVIIETAKNNLSSDSWLIVRSLMHLGRLNFDEFKKNIIAEEYFQKALEIIAISERNNDVNKTRINHYLVKILLDNNEEERAKILLKETIEFSKSVLGIKHEETKPLLALQLQKFPISSFSRQITVEYKRDLSSNDYNKIISDAFRVESQEKKVRVFISSTFRDMMPEREYLMKNVFPKLRKLCRTNGFDFTEIDLRWGITEKDAENGKVIEICLNEIDKSRPFFIGMIGERYGWIPEYENSSNFKKMLRNYDWLENDVQSKLSVTEMEIQYGVLRNPAMKGNAFFYIRDKKITHDDTTFIETKDSLEYKKLEELKSNLRQQDSFPAKKYYSIEELGSFIFENLRDAIFGDEISESKLSNLDEAREKQINFVKSYTDFYIPDSKTSHMLHKFATSKSNIFLKQSNKLVVYGKNGIGKTALLANYVKEHYLNDEKKPLLFHFVEANQDSKKSGEIIKRIIDEINLFSFTGVDFQNVDHQNPAPILEDAFKKTDEEIVIIIDGLEKIWTHEFFSRLYWLPENIPSNVKLILSTNNEELFNSLKQSGYKSVTVDVLGKTQRESFIINYLNKFGKKLPANVVKTIVKDEISLLPFSLKLLLDEARIFGVFEDLNDFIDNYLSANNNVELFIKLFERMEGDYEDKSKGLVGNVLSFIALSKHGLTENEIVEFAESATLYWSPIYNSIENYLHRNIGQLSIRNVEFAEAVKIKYLTNEKMIRNHHQKMANYFEQIEDNERKFDELSHHLKELGEYERLKNHLSIIDVFLLYYRFDPSEILKYWNELKVHYIFSDTYKKALDVFEQTPNVNPLDIASASEKIGRLVGLEGGSEEAIYFIEKSFKITKKIFGENHLETAKALTSLSGNYQTLMKYEYAEKYALEALAIFEQNNIRDMKYVAILSTLSQMYLEQGKLDLAEKYILKEKSLLEIIWDGESLGSALPLTQLAQIAIAKGNLDQGEDYSKKALSIIERYGGNNHMIMFTALDALVEIYIQKEEFDDALEMANKSLSNKLESYGSNHILVITSQLMKATILVAQENFEEAKVIAKDNLEISNSILGTEHKLTRTGRELLISADMQIDMKLFLEEKYEKVVSSILENYNKSNRELGKEHKLTQTILKMLVKCYEILSDVEKEEYYKQFFVDEENVELNIQQSNEDSKDNEVKEKIDLYTSEGEQNYKNENYNDALSNFKEAIKLQITLFGNDNEDVANSFTNIGDCYYWIEEPDQAIANYKEALKIQIELYGDEHGDIVYSYWNIGHCYYMDDKYKEAITNYLKELEIKKKLFGATHEEVANSYISIGDCYYYDDNYDEAIPNHQKALEIRVNLLGDEHQDSADCYFKLGMDYVWSENYDLAIKHHKKAFEIRKSLFGKKSEEAEKSNFELGKSYYYSDMKLEAKECFSYSLKLRKKIFGKNSEEYKDVKEWIENL